MNEPAYTSPSQLAPRIYEYVLAGLILTLTGAGLVGYHVYHGFVTLEIERELAYWGMGLPFIGVAAGLYVFSYGWQRGDVEKAVRMSMWLTLGAVAIIAAVLGALALKRIVRSGVPGGIRLGGSVRGRSGWYAGSDTHDQYDDSRPLFARRTPGVAAGIEIHCTKCGELFIPQAPGAYCPACGHSAVGRPRQAG